MGYGTDDLDLSNLLNLYASGYVGTLPSFAKALDLLSGRMNTEQRTYNVLTRNIIRISHTTYNGITQEVYAGTYYEAVAVIALSLHFDIYTAAEKRTLAGRIVQEAIDFLRSDASAVLMENRMPMHGYI